MEEFFFFKSGNEGFRIDTNSILYIHAEKRYVTFITSQKCYPAQVSIGYIEKLLSPKLFCRVHRSYIISLKHTDKFDNDLVYIGKAKIPIADSYKNVFKQAITIIRSDRPPIILDGGDVDKLLNDLNR